MSQIERELVGSLQGPYSAAAIAGNIVWTSGALPIDERGATPSDFREQVRLALGNLERSLRLAGAGWSTVLKINAYVLDIEKLPELNEIYAAVVTESGKPARTTVQVAKFRGDYQVEFDAVATTVGRPL